LPIENTGHAYPASFNHLYFNVKPLKTFKLYQSILVCNWTKRLDADNAHKTPHTHVHAYAVKIHRFMINLHLSANNGYDKKKGGVTNAVSSKTSAD
jgi:hypothetical protein